MRVLVTGGAGYIGSHMVLRLLRAGAEVVVLDDLSAGHAELVPPEARLIQASIADHQQVRAALQEQRTEAVIHFAGRIQVGESMSKPRLYWEENVEGSRRLLEAVLDAGVQHLVFSSSAAVYGVPARVPIEEEDATVPVNTYGETKLATERMLATYARAHPLRYAALRYFNAAGAEPGSGLGERHQPETHLIPLMLEAVLGRRPPLTVYGQDYPTADGTCVRDYVHVMDLADAHLAALEHLSRGGESGAFNLGSGQGCSVREVIETVELVTGARVPLTYGPRRDGDPPALVASPHKAQRVLGWRAARSGLETIVSDAWAWHSRR